MAHRTAKQKAATRKMIAANRAARGGTRKRKGAKTHAKKGYAKKGHKRSSARKGSSVAARVAHLESTVGAHSTFIAKQRTVNTIFRDAIAGIYSHTGIAGGPHMRRLGAG